MFAAGQSWDTWWADTPKTTLCIREIQRGEVWWIKMLYFGIGTLNENVVKCYVRISISFPCIFYVYPSLKARGDFTDSTRQHFWRRIPWNEERCGEIVRGVERVSQRSRVRCRRHAYRCWFCHPHDRLRPRW